MILLEYLFIAGMQQDMNRKQSMDYFDIIIIINLSICNLGYQQIIVT